MRDAEIVGIEQFSERHEALEAAGLPDNLFGKVPSTWNAPARNSGGSRLAPHARYCACDVAGERGAGAALVGGIQ
jgi:hypothetical protein